MTLSREREIGRESERERQREREGEKEREKERGREKKRVRERETFITASKAAVYAPTQRPCFCSTKSEAVSYQLILDWYTYET